MEPLLQSPQPSFTPSSKVPTLASERKSALRQPSKRKLVLRPPHYQIIFQDEDLTPQPLNPIGGDDTLEKQVTLSDLGAGETGVKTSMSARSLSIFAGQNLSRFHTELHNQTVGAQSYFQHSKITTAGDEDLILGDDVEDSEGSTKTYSGSVVSDLFRYEDKKIPTHITLTLAETPTFYILDLSSSTVEKDTEEGTAAMEDNQQYDFLTIGKGRNRKVIHAEVQTQEILLKSRTTEARRPRRKHNYAFASNWEMYDTYNDKQMSQQPVRHAIQLEDEDDANFEMTNEKQMEKLLKNSRFREALIVTERLLANNNFNIQQKRFRGLLKPDPFREKIEYDYRLDLLWTFANSDTEGRCVVAMDWNPANSDILAVGYGKFLFSEETKKGIVMIWNIKNPVQPERHYNFNSPITSLQFSRQCANVLAIGFYNGIIKIINITFCEVYIISRSRQQDALNYEPIWQVLWYQNEEHNKGFEQLIATGQDGRIRRYRETAVVDSHCMKIMRSIRAEGKLKGLETMRRCNVQGIPISRYSPALCIATHPINPDIYFVGTGEGVVHKCSIDHYHQHLDLFVAHDGPVYHLKLSPFCNKLLMTCGDDWAIRIWCEGIDEPVLELIKGMDSVQAADWSPVHSTVIASVSKNDVYLWDIQRKTYHPQSITRNPADYKNTVVQFTPSGRCLCVGDTNGNVHIFALEDMPFPAFFQEDLLSQAFRKAMITKPDLLRQMKKIGTLSFDRQGCKRHFR